jgi:hypothetical protein
MRPSGPGCQLVAAGQPRLIHSLRGAANTSRKLLPSFRVWRKRLAWLGVTRGGDEGEVDAEYECKERLQRAFVGDVVSPSPAPKFHRVNTAAARFF